MNAISEEDIMKGRKLPELRNLPQSNRLFDDAANEHNLSQIKCGMIQYENKLNEEQPSKSNLD